MHAVGFVIVAAALDWGEIVFPLVCSIFFLTAADGLATSRWVAATATVYCLFGFNRFTKRESRPLGEHPQARL